MAFEDFCSEIMRFPFPFLFVLSIQDFHRSIPGYEVTPLVQLSALAKELNVNNVFVKDESHRLGLKAYKVIVLIYINGKGNVLGNDDIHCRFWEPVTRSRSI